MKFIQIIVLKTFHTKIPKNQPFMGLIQFYERCTLLNKTREAANNPAANAAVNNTG